MALDTVALNTKSIKCCSIVCSKCDSDDWNGLSTFKALKLSSFDSVPLIQMGFYGSMLALLQPKHFERLLNTEW